MQRCCIPRVDPFFGNERFVVSADGFLVGGRVHVRSALIVALLLPVEDTVLFERRRFALCLLLLLVLRCDVRLLLVRQFRRGLWDLILETRSPTAFETAHTQYTTTKEVSCV